MKTKMKTLIICPGTQQMTDSVFLLIDPDNGEILNDHFCSNYTFAKGDLLHSPSDMFESLIDRFGEDFDVKFIDESDYTEKEIEEKVQKFYGYERDKISR